MKRLNYAMAAYNLNTVPYNTVILQLLKSNMNIKFLTGIYAILTYLISYISKPKDTTSEFMKKAWKESYGRNAWEKWSAWKCFHN